jgi:DNA-binding transcriptional MocR family regulator
VYGEMYFGVRRPPPAKSFDQDGGVLHCSSFSKSLAPGYRLGWTAAGRYALTPAFVLDADEGLEMGALGNAGGHDALLTVNNY